MTDVDKKKVDEKLERVKFEVAQEMGILNKKPEKKQKIFKKS